LGYRVIIVHSAEKELERLHSGNYDRVTKKLLSLEDNPRPRGVKKLTGREEYRLRVGDYRILYFIDDKNQTVIVSAVGHRGDVYG
jgi:mRNA interferase RelE/StbE